MTSSNGRRKLASSRSEDTRACPDFKLPHLAFAVPGLLSQIPARLVANLTHEPLRCVHVREHESVTDPIQCQPQSWKSFRRRREERGDAMLARQAVIGGKTERPLPHCLEVSQVGAATPPAPLFDVVRKQTTQPKCVIAQMCTGQKTAVRVPALDLLAK